MMPCHVMSRFHDLRLTAMEARVHFLANFLEVCRLNNHGCPWSLRRVTNESRVGELSGGLHPDYQVGSTAVGEFVRPVPGPLGMWYLPNQDRIRGETLGAS